MSKYLWLFSAAFGFMSLMCFLAGFLFVAFIMALVGTVCAYIASALDDKHV